MFRLDELEEQRAAKRQANDLDRESQKSINLENSSPITTSHVIDMDLSEEDSSSEDLTSHLIVVREKNTSLEEDRAQAYQSRLATSDSFNTFQFWREPVQSLVLPEALIATDQEDENSNETTKTEKETKPLMNVDLPLENEFEDEEEEMEIEPLFGDEDDFDDSRVEELHKLENHLKRVLDKGNKEMDHLTQELSEAKLGNNSGLLII